MIKNKKGEKNIYPVPLHLELYNEHIHFRHNTGGAV